jgi:predicted transcriptional regulator
MDTNNAAGLPDFEISLRTGWKDEEKLLLWDEVKKAQKMGAPLKRVFETVARQTGRKPNSVRNYYYMKVKETGEIEQKPSTFVQFSREEIYELLRTLLAAGARGESIRGASLKLAGGDKTLMLRYQNKYRSLIKSARPLVEMVMGDMDQEGEKYVSPYETQKTSAVRENRYIPESVTRALSGADVDVKAFFKGLAKIAALAAASAQAEQELQMTEAQTENIRKENAALSANVRDLSAKLKKEMERSVKAATLYQQLMKMNASPELKNMESLAGLGELLGAHTNADAL